MIGQEIDHALIQVAHHVGDLLMLAFEIFQLQSNRARGADFRARDRVVIEDLEEEYRFFAVVQAELAEIPRILVAQDEPLGILFLQADFIFAVADLGDQGDFADAEIIARAVFQRQGFVTVDFQVFGRSQQIDRGKTVRFDAQLITDRRVVKTVAVFD